MYQEMQLEASGPSASCGTIISGSTKATSNFWTHLKVQLLQYALKKAVIIIHDFILLHSESMNWYIKS